MHVGLGDVRKIEVHHVRETVDVDAARGDVRRDEDATRAITEAVHRLVACVLRFVAVDGRRRDAGLLEVRHEAIGAVLGAREDERGLHLGVLEELNEKRGLLLVLAEVELLLDALGRCRRRRHRDAHGVREQAVCKLTNIARHGGREEERLTLRRQLRDEALHVRKEAHVEHAVRFIEDEDLDVAKRELLLLQEIEKASWRGHDDVDAAIQLADLRLLIHAAEDDGVEDLETLTVGGEVLSNLCRELACGCDDEPTQGHLVTRGCFESLKHRERESGGFASSCLCASKDIAACKGRRNRLKLNGRRLRVAFFCDGLKNRGRETKVRKIHAASSHGMASTQATRSSHARPTCWWPTGEWRYEARMKRTLSTLLLVCITSACSGGEEPTSPARERPHNAGPASTSTAARAPSAPSTSRVSADIARARTQPSTRPASAGESPITLVLQWPEGARGHVDARRDVTGAGNASGSAQWGFAMRRDGARNIIDTRGLDVQITPGPLDEDRLNSLLVALSIWPSLSMDAQGQVALRDGEATRNEIRRALARDLTPELRDLAAQSPAGVLFDTSDESLQRLAESHTATVSSLEGDTFIPGEPRTARTSATSAVGIELEQDVVTSLTGIGPCFEGDEATRCAWITMRATADVTPLQEAAELAQQPLTMGALVNEARVVVEVATLLPHSITLEKTTTMVVHEGVTDHPVESREVSAWVFHYEPTTIRP